MSTLSMPACFNLHVRRCTKKSDEVRGKSKYECYFLWGIYRGDGPLWLDVIDALPKTLAEPLAASVKSNEPSNSAIKQRIDNGGVVEGASVKRGYHLRIE
jgi:hypothetical protein